MLVDTLSVNVGFLAFGTVPPDSVSCGFDCQDDGYLHLLSACTNENWHTEECPSNRDTTRPLSMMRRSLSVVAEMAAVVDEEPDPKWAETYVRTLHQATGRCMRPICY